MPFGRLDVVVDAVEVDVREVGAPVRHRPLQVVLVRLEPEVEHPFGLVLHPRDLLDLGPVKPPLALVDVVFLVSEAVLVLADIDLCDWTGGLCNHGVLP